MLKLFAKLFKSPPPAPLNQIDLIAQARLHLDQKKIPEGILLLKKELKERPGNSDALNSLAFAYSQTKELDKALQCIELAISIEPKGAGYHSNLGDILNLRHDFPSAESAYRKQIELTPEYANGYLLLAKFLADKGRASDALNICQEAFSKFPENDFVRVHTAFYTLHDVKDYRRVVEILDPVLERNPTNIHARVLAANARISLDDLVIAERLLKSILQESQDNVDALIGLGLIKLIGLKGEESEAYFRLALGTDPNNAQAAQLLISLLLETGKFDQAADLLAAFSSQYPNEGAFRRLQGKLAALTGMPHEAIEHFKRAIELIPGDIDSMELLANMELFFGRTQESITLHSKVLSFYPTRQMTFYNLAFSYLMSGNFLEGFKCFESRLKIAYEPNTPYGLRETFLPILKAMKNIPMWDGKTSIAGKRLLVWREQGFGDFLMSMRFLPELKKLSPARLGLVVHGELEKLTDAMNIADEIIPSHSWDSAYGSQNYDLHCSIMSLPHFFNATPASVGEMVPYLFPQKERVDQWKSTLHGVSARIDSDETRSLRVGIVWAGSPSLAMDNARSLSLGQLEPLMKVPDIEWISLQKGPAQKQLAQQAWPIVDIMEKSKDFNDTVAILMNLDLIISVDTAVVHLAGAVGKDVWVFNRAGSEWRWMLNREESPWYPSLLLFNQGHGEAWETVIQRMAEKLSVFSLQHKRKQTLISTGK